MSLLLSAILLIVVILVAGCLGAILAIYFIFKDWRIM